MLDTYAQSVVPQNKPSPSASAPDAGGAGEVQYQTALALFGHGRDAEALQSLSQAAEAGHVSSMALMGSLFLQGKGVPQDFVAGARLIMASAERGGGYACALAGMLWASRLVGQPDWPRALDYVQRAAELGYPPAQEQLRVLGGDRSRTDWKALRGAFDISAWRRCPQPRTLSEDPLIQAVPGLLAPEVCDALIAWAVPRLGPARTYDEVIGKVAVQEGRRNSAAECGLVDLDLVHLAVRERLSALAGLTPLHSEACQVLNYQVGERFTHHFDFFEPAIQSHAREIAERGQRAITVLVYLNDEGLEGGETDFSRLGLRHRGREGDGLLFHNLDAHGQPDRRTLHAGLSPTAGEKWLLTLWIRDRPGPSIGDPRLIAALGGR